MRADTRGGWEEAATKSIEHLNLENECLKWFGGEEQAFLDGTARCFNHWDAAPAEVTGGYRTIRGGAPQDAVDGGGLGWCLAAPAPFGTDVEFYRTPEASRSRTEDEPCTLGKVAFFLEHRRNGGENKLWVAVAEYVSNGRGQGRVNDPATGHAVMRLKRTLTFFPSTAIRRVAHMYHRCNSACKAVTRTSGGVGVLEHSMSAAGDSIFLHNEHFHVTGT